MLARLVPANACTPILVTLLGMTTLVRPAQFMNALPAILVTPLGMTTLVTEVLSSPKTGDQPSPTFFTAYPPNTLGIVTAPVAVEAVIVAPPFSTM
jgi:hypothetical protein